MTNRARTSAGVVWALFAIGCLVYDAVEQWPTGLTLSIGYYVVAWGFLMSCIVGGAMAALGHSVGRWLVVATAVLFALYQLWLLLAYGPDSGPLREIQELGAILFAIVVAVVVGRKQPNTTVERDGPQAARPSL